MQREGKIPKGIDVMSTSLTPTANTSSIPVNWAWREGHPKSVLWGRYGAHCKAQASRPILRTERGMVQRSLSSGSRNVVWVLRAPQRSWRRPWVLRTPPRAWRRLQKLALRHSQSTGNRNVHESKQHRGPPHIPDGQAAPTPKLSQVCHKHTKRELSSSELVHGAHPPVK